MLTIVDADFNQPGHNAALLYLLNAYACDPMGGAEPLSDFCQANLISELKKRNTVHAVLAFVDDEPAGFSLCILGFSTFACQPLMNIHDIAGASAFRGQGIGRQLLRHIEQLARKQGCCKITLEVLQGNLAAQALYSAVGFADYQLDPAMGSAVMMQKKL